MESRSIFSKLCSIGVAVAVAFGAVSESRADQAALTYSDTWKFDSSGYGFIPFSTQGTSTIAGSSVDLDMDLKDALDVLDLAFAGRFEAWHGNLGFIVDLNYIELTDDEKPSSSVSVEIETKQAWLGLLAAYRVASGITPKGGKYSIDVQGGARYNSLKQTADVDIDGPPVGGKLGGTETWWEPVVGARAIWKMDDRWNGFAAADAGGFGVGGNHLSWSATLGAGYKVGENGALKFGMRYYSIDFSTNRSDGKFAYDINQWGPIFGYTYSF